MPPGPLELGLILLAVLVIFGAGKLAGIGGALGKSIREFRREVNESGMEAERPDGSQIERSDLS